MRLMVVLISLFSLLTIIVTWPLILHLNTAIIDPHDGLLITWFLNWDIHSLTGGLKTLSHFYDANIFYPYKGTLAFSEIMLPEAIITLPFVLWTGEPLVAYNLNLIFGFIATGVAMYLLLEYLTKKRDVSLFFAVLFNFSTIHLNYLPHLQLFNFLPVIFSMLFFLQRRYKLFILFFFISSLTTALFFYFLLLCTSILLFHEIRTKEKGVLLGVVHLSITSLVTSIFLLPYYLVSRQFHYVRPITDSIHFSLQFPDLLNVSVMSRLSAFVPPLTKGTPAYPGMVFLLLASYIFWNHRPCHQSMFLLIALVSFILALGPALHIYPNTVHVGPLPAIPLPYLALYYLVPGFSGFRTPSRWIILTAFSLTVALAIYFARRINWKWALILSTLVILEINFPFRYSKVPSVKDFPPEQVWLRDNFQAAPLIQFPIYRWDDAGVGQETLREYYSTIHWHPMYNGYSGFSPKEWEQRVRWLQKNFPSDESVNYLKSLGIKLILAPKDWDDKMTKYSNLKLLQKFPQTTIYEVL